MKVRWEQTDTRRGFFRRVGQGVAGAAVAALGAVLVFRGGRRDPDQTCINDGLCRGCPRLGGCVLPRAQITRRMSAGRSRRQ